MSNKEIEIKILQSGLMKWQIATAIGIADTTFSKWLRTPLTDEKQALIVSAIEKLSRRDM